ncbi:hypothetical protein HYDPIDRAFT_28769 [Hydnomerulius pinastri MD-312]|uniref:Uncharacterized protein n=1 Tax=Hydnomerulius pinastri MD-312 TaxID=994086 RepID=A0A0C9W0M1_9AGAM|nr:hypothetical protein HYDPIDRAFT_28769 [Hydnomerulius pinastri MD-312]
MEMPAVYTTTPQLAQKDPLIRQVTDDVADLGPDTTSLLSSVGQYREASPFSDDQTAECGHDGSSARQEASANSRSRVLCYLLHAALLSIHAMLFGLYSRHVEHGLTVAITPSANNLNVVLSACLQAVYTIYTAILVYITQSCALWYTLSRMQKLTTIHDVAGAWSGLGAALGNLWQQRTLAASSWQTLSVTTYLACVAILHISSSTVMQFQMFNTTTTAWANSTQAWPDNYSAIPTSSSNMNAVTGAVPAIMGMPTLSTAGLVNNTLYDTFSGVNQPGVAFVNATTISASCGLIANASYRAITSSSQGVNTTTWTISVPLNDTLNYVIDEVPTILYNSTIMYLPSQSFQNSTYISPLPVSNPIFLASTLMDIAPSNENATAFGFQMPLWYGTDVDVLQTLYTTVYLIGCSLESLNSTAMINPQNNALLQPIQDTASGPPPSAWEASTLQPRIYTGDVLDVVNSALSSADASVGFCQTGVTTNWQVHYDTCWLEFSSGTIYPEHNTVTTFVLNQSRMESIVGQIFAETVWLGVQYGNVSGGFFRNTFDRQYQQEEQKWRLNINFLPLLFATMGSFTMLALSLRLTGAFSKQLDRPLTSSAGVLEVLWWAAQSRIPTDTLEGVTDPTTEELRSAGMFSVHLVEERRGDTKEGLV